MILPSEEERGIVVFWVLPSVPYQTRLKIAFLLVAVGFIIQIPTRAVLPGIIGIVLGNLLLLVKGYDNRVDPRGFEPEAHWERAGMEKLDELKALDRKMRKWDESFLDITNPLGGVVFVFVFGGLGAAAWFSRGELQILAIDAIALFAPHWLTGIRAILRRPGLLVRIDAIQGVLQGARRHLEQHNVTPLMLLGGGESPIPEDIKFKVDIADHHPDFLGLYGQVVINEVQGKSYPYFYVVLVARNGFGMRNAFQRFRTTSNITKEFKREGEVEVFIIRQHTTDKSGYHTEPFTASTILREGLKVAEDVAGAPSVAH